MRPVITSRTLSDQRRALLGWAFGLAALTGLYVSIWPSLRDQPSLQGFLDRLPPAFRALFAANGADLTSAPGYLQVELLSVLAPMLMLLYAINAGAAAIAGEEDRRTMEELLANPISRDRLVLEKFAALLAGVLGLTGAAMLAVLGEGAAAGMRLPAGRMLAALVQLGLLALLFGTLALAVGALTGRAAASRAVPALVAMLSYALNALGELVGWLRAVRPASPFYAYLGSDPLRHGLFVPGLFGSAATVAVLLALAVVGFRRRDVR